MSKVKKVVFGIVGAFVLLIAMGAVFGEDRPEQASSSQDTSYAVSQESEKPLERAEQKTGEIKLKDGRLNALAVVQVYRTNHIINKGSKFEINEGTSLDQVFTKQKESHLIKEGSRWVVLKDGDRYVVMYHGNFSGIEGGRGSNNPQWVVLPQKDLTTFSDAKIHALNGTAKAYTPELGEVDIQDDGSSKALKFYLRWEFLMEENNWDETKNQTTLDRVAKEFSVSNEEADMLFSQGQKERDGQGKSKMDERGDVLSDERIIQLLQEQGDLYIGK